ncbi:MAG: TonB-dependent receptor [Bacteroidaceae bacterium]|nr:TonB-dependent receptor [Bacteroidaceae bacterium]
MASNFYFSLLVFSFSLFLHAQSPDSTFYLNDVVVTGTRTPKLLKDVPIQTRLITADDIEKVDATNVVDLMQQELPGVEFSYAMNQQLHLNFSGFGGQSILFLVDGERMAGETLDDIDFTRLNMANIERIEIVKGAASALYGSNAGGGVINLITKEGTRPWTLNYNTHVGYHNYRCDITWGLNRKHWRNAMTLHTNLNGGYDVKNGPNPAAQVVHHVYDEDVVSVKDRFTYMPTDHLKLIGRIGRFMRYLPRDPKNPDYYHNFSSGFRMLWEISERDNLDFSYSLDQYDKSVHYDITHKDIRQYSNSQNILRGVFNHSFSRGDIFTLGADYCYDYLMNKNLERETYDQRAFDAFAQYDWLINPQWEVVSALRYDYFSDGNDSRLTPKISARYKILPTGGEWEGAIRFGYGMGFRAPSLKEKYYNFDMAGIWMVNGNPHLKAEVSHNFNVSADFTKGHYNLTASAYYNAVRNKLATGVPHHGQEVSTQLYLDYINLDNYSVYGGDVTLQARWDNGLSARLSYAYTNEHTPHDKDGNTVNSQYIPARHHSLTARIDWDKQFTHRYGLRLSLNGRFLSSVKSQEYVNYYDISEGTKTVKYPAYTLWKLSATQRFGTAFRWTLALDNLLNYRPQYYYFNSPMTEGLTFMATLSLDVEELFKR